MPRLRMHRAGRATAAVLAAVAVTASACTGAATPDASSASPWSAVALPAGQVPVTLTAAGTTLVVGVQDASSHAPGLLTVDVGGGALGRVAVRPESPYAPLARWLSVGVRDGAVVAIGGARGGAHANVRWTVWRGSLQGGVAEEPQTFETFGGWGAGDLIGVVTPTDGAALVGEWASDGAGLDTVVWLPRGTTWLRHSSTGTALASTRTALVGPRGVATWGDGALVVGSLLHLGDGVRQRPAVWRSPRGVGGFARVDLPDGDQPGEAISASCGGGGCVVAGWVSGRLALWRVDEAGTVSRDAGVPDIGVSPSRAVPAPVLEGGSVTVLVTDAGSTRLLRAGGTGQGWSVTPGPAGTASALVTAAGSCWALTTGPGAGDATLWQAPLDTCGG